ncbi:MAG: TerB family tellurite resistance protein [Gammaproteobacteria bacterium]|nr:TerB family tellurite resistance protein [Gammaproteobacteria bacterium]
MLKKLKDLFISADVAHENDDNKRLQVSLAALLVEIARADFDETAEEDNEITRILVDYFSVSADEAIALLTEAQVATDDSVSLYEFIRTLHASLSAEERLKVIELLWQLALSDKILNKYEDHLVRKIADLMYVPNSDVIRIKNQVLGI